MTTTKTATQPTWAIVYTYAGEREIIDTANDWPEAKMLLAEYRLAFQGAGSVTYRRLTRTERKEYA